MKCKKCGKEKDQVLVTNNKVTKTKDRCIKCSESPQDFLMDCFMEDENEE